MCDTMVRVGSSGVIFAKNSDRDPNEAQLLEWNAAGDHSPGSMVHCTWIEIPQIAHTEAILISRPYWMWGAEMGSNEHGVTIGNEAVFTKQPYANTGLTGMDLLRLGLERSRSAEEAVSVIIALLEKHGQGGGCGHENRSFTYHNSFLIADPSEAWVVETAEALWATERVRQGGRSISNGLTIPGFAEKHTDWLKTTVSQCRRRQPSTQKQASLATSPAEFMGILRQHGSPYPSYSVLNGAMAAPCMHAGGLATGSQTTASWVADLGSELHWVTATAAPCTSIFKPVTVGIPVDTGPPPSDSRDNTSVWWRHEKLHRLAMTDPRSTFPIFEKDRNAIEAKWLANVPDSQAAFSESARLTETWVAHIDALQSPDKRPWYVRRYWQTREKNADKQQEARAG